MDKVTDAIRAVGAAYLKRRAYFEGLANAQGRYAEPEDWHWVIAGVETSCRRMFREVRMALKELRAVVGVPQAKGRPRKNVQVSEVKRLRADGLGVSALAKKFGVSRQTIYRALGE